MKNNFDLKKFLVENKLTENSKLLTELKDVEDGRDIGGKIIEFADGGNVDINIDYQRGKTKDFKDVPVEKAIDIVNQYIDQNDLTQASTDETNRILQVDDGDTAIDITKAGMSEIDADLLKRAQNTPAPKDGSARLAKRKASLDNEKAGTLQVSKGSNAEQEQRVIDIARDAIALMDEQPGTSAEDALNSVLGL
tara:strand:- start:57 stop:638 length:582 start_codon:yes stop_codon:yes gene_type:complete